MSSRVADTSTTPATQELGWPLTRRLLSPVAVLCYVYVIYFAVTYSRIYEYVYWELMNLGTRIIGFHPTGHTLAVYAYGLIVLAFGFVAGDMVASGLHRVREGRESVASSTEGTTESALAKRVRGVFARLNGIRTKDAGFVIALLGWLVGMAANAQQLVASGAISLTSISTRWAQSPVLVLLAASQILFVPALIVTAKGSWRRTLAAVLFIVSVLALGLLGARNLPAKLVVASFLAVVYAFEPRTIRRLLVVFLVIGVAAMGIVGAISKSGIYGPSATASLAVALTYSDSVGTSYNLDRIVNLTPSTGVYEGKLLRDSIKASIPGVDAEYANFQLGRYLGGRSYFMIGGELINRSVSLAPTLIGAPYADWGVPGVAGQMALLGLLLGYLQRRARRVVWFVPILAAMASYVINGVNAGVHNPHALIFISAAVLVSVVDIVLAVFRGRSSVRVNEG